MYGFKNNYEKQEAFVTSIDFSCGAIHNYKVEDGNAIFVSGQMAHGLYLIQLATIFVDYEYNINFSSDNPAKVTISIVTSDNKVLNSVTIYGASPFYCPLIPVIIEDDLIDTSITISTNYNASKIWSGGADVKNKMFLI